MEVVTAVGKIVNCCPSVFLAGGVTNCPEWQREVIRMLVPGRKGGIIYNPRRATVNMGDPEAARKQIEWEFKALAVADVFSMWFCDADSDQPICMYELGRHLALRYDPRMRSFSNIVVGIEKGYRREQDVRIQMGLLPSTGGFTEKGAPRELITTTLEDHAARILEALRDVARGKLGHLVDGRQ